VSALPTDAEHLRGHTPESLARRFARLGLALPVARRVCARLIADDRDSLDGLPGLARHVREGLLAEGRLERLEVLDRRRSQLDPFVKYLFRSGDGRVFEAVRIPLERPRYSVCVSSQVGCALGCAFCETGRLGLDRNLAAWEMVEQVLTVRREALDRPVTGVVFQGQGEPLQNYENVLRAAAILRDPSCLRLRGDRISISSVGLVPAIERFTAEGHPYRLIVSLTSAIEERRRALLPLARRHPLPELARALRRYAEARRTTLNLAWVLMAGVNSDPAEARALRALFPGLALRVSVIDVNDPSGRFRRADDAERGAFLSALAEQRIGFVRRYSGGPDIDAACGMLASRARGGVALAATAPV
jgi:23S rRNA (adenine2503-C2)-methyltransferase